MAHRNKTLFITCMKMYENPILNGCDNNETISMTTDQLPPLEEGHKMWMKAVKATNAYDKNETKKPPNNINTKKANLKPYSFWHNTKLWMLLLSFKVFFSSRRRDL